MSSIPLLDGLDLFEVSEPLSLEFLGRGDNTVISPTC